jgi:hypothetical protein
MSTVLETCRECKQERECHIWAEWNNTADHPAGLLRWARRQRVVMPEGTRGKATDS